MDLVVSGLALSHVPDLAPVMAEFARVLRPGGQLAISNVHEETMFLGSVPHATGPGGEPGLVTSYRHSAGDFLRAALPVGLQVRRCEEPGRPPVDRTQPPPPAELAVTGWDHWPWSLIGLVPEAAWAAWAVPAVTVWHFELRSP
jgi:SAM-dependent methyltransferase